MRELRKQCRFRSSLSSGNLIKPGVFDTPRPPWTEKKSVRTLRNGQICDQAMRYEGGENLPLEKSSSEIGVNEEK
jgi:hypothetical protein